MFTSVPGRAVSPIVTRWSRDACVLVRVGVVRTTGYVNWEGRGNSIFVSLTTPPSERVSRFSRVVNTYGISAYTRFGSLFVNEKPDPLWADGSNEKSGRTSDPSVAAS